MAHVPATTGEAIALLRDSIEGPMFAIGDSGYDEALGAAAAGRGRPLVIVFAQRTDDIVEAVRFARAEHLAVAVRSCGQRGWPRDRSVLIDVTALDRVDVEPDCHTATVGAGASWARVVDAAGQHGLTPVLGEWPLRSAVSDTLAGAMGWLARRYGLASDSALGFELVTPDGLVVDVSADSHPELFWALSGAGDGSLGVVAAIELELHPVRRVYAGSLTYPVELAADVLARWRTWITGTRPELTTSVVVDRDRVTVHGCWSGAFDAGQQLVDDWRAWREPASDDWTERSVAELGQVGDPRLEPLAATTWMTNEWANSLRDELFAELLTIAGDTESVSVVEVRLVGGATRSRSGSAANGRGRRDQFLITIAGDGQRPETLRDRLAPFVTGAVHLDRADPEERSRRTRQAYGPEEWDRLLAVKAAIDPGNRFQHGLPIESPE